MGGSTKEEVVTVKPSRAFLASLQAEKQEQAALEKPRRHWRLPKPKQKLRRSRDADSCFE